MAKAYTCDITGKVCEGDGDQRFVVTFPIGKNHQARVRLYHRKGVDQFINSQIGPETEAKLQKALESVLIEAKGK